MPLSGTAGLLTIRERRFEFRTTHHAAHLRRHRTAYGADACKRRAEGGLGLLLVKVAIGGGVSPAFVSSPSSTPHWRALPDTGALLGLPYRQRDFPGRTEPRLPPRWACSASVSSSPPSRLHPRRAAARTEAIAERRGVDLANLTQVNALVSQHMQIGVLVCDADGHVRLGNQAAQKFLGQALASGNCPRSRRFLPISPSNCSVGWAKNRAAAVGAACSSTRAGYTVLPRFVALARTRPPAR